MAQTSYGSITVTDTTDITDVYLEYCMVEAGKTASEVESKSSWVSPEMAWSTIYPAWQSGYEIWVRQVQIKEGIESGIYTIQFSATTTGSVIFRLHGYDSNGQWLRQLFTTTITSTSTLPIIQTLELPSDIKFVRLSYPLTGVENTGIFKGESTSNGTGLINVSTNESGSIPASGTPATNSSFNRTQLIAVYPQGYGTPFLDTAVNQINNLTNEINNTINIVENFKYQIKEATEGTPIFGTYIEKTINYTIIGSLSEKIIENQGKTFVWLDSNGSEVSLSNNTLCHDMIDNNYYIYNNNNFTRVLYDEGFLQDNTFFHATNQNDIKISEIDKYYDGLFYANRNTTGATISNPKYYTINDENWLEDYIDNDNITNPVYWIKHTSIYANNIVQTDIYEDKNFNAIYKKFKETYDSLVDFKKEVNRFFWNEYGSFVVLGLNNYNSFDSNTYGYNYHANAGGIYLRYNEFNYTSLNQNGLTFNYLIYENSIPIQEGPKGMVLNKEGIEFYQLYQKNNNNNITYESKPSITLTKDKLSFYSAPKLNDPDGNAILRMELNNQNLDFYSVEGEKIASFGENTFLKGNITANGGFIGGLVIGENGLYTGEHTTLNSTAPGLYISYDGDISGGPQSQSEDNNSGWALNKNGTGHFGDAQIVYNESTGAFEFQLKQLKVINSIEASNFVLDRGENLQDKIDSLVQIGGNINKTIIGINEQLNNYTSHIQVKHEVIDEEVIHNYILITAGEINEEGAEEIKSGLKLHDQYIAFQISDGEGGTVQAAKMTNDTLEIDKINLGYTLDFGRYILEERVGGIEGTHFSILVE